MIKLSVPDMTCGHCVGVVEKAIRGVDAAAAVTTDLGTKTVVVKSTANAATLSKAVDAAGYPNKAL